ncbi:MAG: hypothetical protein K2H09_06195 [Treponemataceae bacterium]|nr:hypothetical protein [Treponemataceae bacterium]
MYWYSTTRPGIIQPYTWEGCVVKIADKIAYLGRDIEDARQYHILDMGAYRHLREIVAETLCGKEKHAFRSGKAVNTTVLINDLIVDLCEQSSFEKGLCFSDEYFRFLVELKKFNFAHIYNHWRLQEFARYATNVIETIFWTLLRTYEYVRHGRIAQALRFYPVLGRTFEEWLIKYSLYAPAGSGSRADRLHILRCNTEPIFHLDSIDSFSKCIVEYISGMTDVFAIQIYEEIISF